MDFGKDQIWWVIAMTVFGAIVHATSQLKISRDRNTDFDYVDFLILFVIALFSGAIFWLVAFLFNYGITIVILFSSIGAFLGIAGLNKIAGLLLDVIATRVSGLSNSKKKND